MALKLDYVLRETGNNLVRNVRLTLASVLTVVVSLDAVRLGAAPAAGRGERQTTASRAASSSSCT